MGTSSSYSGSGGQAWSGARSAARALGGATPTSGAAAAAASAAAAALAGWEDADVDEDAPRVPSQSADTNAPDLSARSPAGVMPSRPSSAAGGGAAGGAAGGGGATGGGGGRIRLGRSRSTRRAARAASGVAAAGYALRAGDLATLTRLGIDATSLMGRSPRTQCQLILNAILDLPRTQQEHELRAAAATTLLALLAEPEPLAPLEVVRIFVGNYLLEILALELAAVFRENGDGLQQERLLRETIDAALASALAQQPGSVTADQLESVIAATLERTRRIMQARRL